MTTFFNDIKLHLAYAHHNFSGNSSHFPLYYGIQYNHRGKLHLRTDRKYDFVVEGPYAFISCPGTFFEYGPGDKHPRDHNFVCFTGPRVNSYIESGLLPIKPENPLIKIHRPDEFYNLISEIIDEVNSRFVDHDQLILKFEKLLLMLHDQNSMPDIAQKDESLLNSRWETPILHKLIEDIERDPQLTWDFDLKSRGIGITSTHFRRLFKQITGMSPHQFVLHQRLRKATELLRGESRLISEIAFMVGINDEFYFSKLFKKKYGISPYNYRKEICSVNIVKSHHR
jgi:AraC-like DNA-binding protein